MRFVNHVFTMWHTKHAWIMIFFSLSLAISLFGLCEFKLFRCWPMCAMLRCSKMYTKVFFVRCGFYSRKIMETKCIQRRELQMDCANKERSGWLFFCASFWNDFTKVFIREQDMKIERIMLSCGRLIAVNILKSNKFGLMPC